MACLKDMTLEEYNDTIPTFVYTAIAKHDMVVRSDKLVDIGYILSMLDCTFTKPEEAEKHLKEGK